MSNDFNNRTLPDRRVGPRRENEVTEQKERQETIYELSDIIFVVQQMGKRLADETHGEGYETVRELNEKLHEVRRMIEKIAQGSSQT